MWLRDPGTAGALNFDAILKNSDLHIRCDAVIAVKNGEGKFPKPVALGPSRTAWFLDEVIEWQETVSAGRTERSLASFRRISLRDWRSDVQRRVQEVAGSISRSRTATRQANVDKA